jgi:hypothetical protein
MVGFADGNCSTPAGVDYPHTFQAMDERFRDRRPAVNPSSRIRRFLRGPLIVYGGIVWLRALAENADLFVVTWLSAKHAATDFIREHRGGRPLLYAQGRGFSSILRAVEDHVRRL